jgi:hypothetical protein
MSDPVSLRSAGDERGDQYGLSWQQRGLGEITRVTLNK